MIQWSTIRQATEEDDQRMEAAAQRFAARHGLRAEYEGSLQQTIETHIYAEDNKHLARLWKAAIRRALREPSADGIYQGYVGCAIR